jgi:hypothetical protein
MCNTGTCPYEKPNGDCSLPTCHWEHHDTVYEDLDDLEARLYDDYEHGDISLAQARKKYASHVHLLGGY